MPSTATGTLQTVDGGRRITGTFKDGNGKTIYLSINPQSPVPQFNASAVLTYTSRQLTGQDSMSGTIGPTNVNLNFSQGETVAASYTTPTDQVAVNGSATWS